ncbi:MAG: hypothetical protein KBD16_00625 [Candidatus Pacebacteria bacterium]|nr:hypothetical protein [Candidatus Paceibacterota bacterium]
MTNKVINFTGIAAIAIVLLAFVVLQGVRLASASAPSGLPATVATTSIDAVTTTGSLVFATSTCAARIITTVASPIMITFTDKDGQIPTGVFGHLQAASTTEVYDSGQYGCNAVKIYSFVASTITVTETR